MTQVTNAQAADVLFNVATILELADDTPYRVRSYRRAARMLLNQEPYVFSSVDGLIVLPGVGLTLRRRITEMLHSGRLPLRIEIVGIEKEPAQDHGEQEGE